jgi:maltose O-acetyltransferase
MGKNTYTKIGKNIPQKPIISYILYGFSNIFFFRIVRLILIRLTMKNCRDIDFEPGFRFFYGRNVFAENVYFSNCFIYDYEKVIIGEHTQFGKDNKIITASHDLYERKLILAKPVTIGKNVWITNNCIILPGVSIGDNSVIGAGSIVTKDIPANCLAAGNPCRIIRKLDAARIKSF